MAVVFRDVEFSDTHPSRISRSATGRVKRGPVGLTAICSNNSTLERFRTPTQD